MENRTNIQIEHETMKRIGKLKLTKGETYDEVLNRMMEDNKKDKYQNDMYIGEFLDRMSILLHKVQKIGPKAYPEFIKYVEKFLLEINLNNFNEAIKGFRSLYGINGKIWHLEADLRKNKEKKLGNAEIGKRAIAIRNWNNKRITIQNNLIEKFGGYPNIKKDHLSEEK